MNSLLPLAGDPQSARFEANELAPVQRVAFVGPIAGLLIDRLQRGSFEAVLRPEPSPRGAPGGGSQSGAPPSGAGPRAGAPEAGGAAASPGRATAPPGAGSPAALAATYRLEIAGVGQSILLDADQARALVPGLTLTDAMQAELTLALGASRADGSVEARVVRTALVGGTAPVAPGTGPAAAAGAPSAPAQLSDAARLLAALLPAAGDPPEAGPAALVKTLLAAAPGPAAAALAAPAIAALTEHLSQLPRASGVGYERALARWMLAGAPPDAVPELKARWPQAQLAPGYVQPGAEAGRAAAPEAAALLAATGQAAPPSPSPAAIAREAQAIESGHVAWRGSLWPGAPAEAQVGRGTQWPSEVPDPLERTTRDWLAALPATEPPAWLRLRMDLPALGRVDLWAVHAEGRTLARLVAQTPATAHALQAVQTGFAQTLEAAHAQLLVTSMDALRSETAR